MQADTRHNCCTCDTMHIRVPLMCVPWYVIILILCAVVVLLGSSHIQPVAAARLVMAGSNISYNWNISTTYDVIEMTNVTFTGSISVVMSLGSVSSPTRSVWITMCTCQFLNGATMYIEGDPAAVDTKMPVYINIQSPIFIDGGMAFKGYWPPATHMTVANMYMRINHRLVWFPRYTFLPEKGDGRFTYCMTFVSFYLRYQSSFLITGANTGGTWATGSGQSAYASFSFTVYEFGLYNRSNLWIQNSTATRVFFFHSHGAFTVQTLSTLMFINLTLICDRLCLSFDFGPNVTFLDRSALVIQDCWASVFTGQTGGDFFFTTVPTIFAGNSLFLVKNNQIFPSRNAFHFYFVYCVVDPGSIVSFYKNSVQGSPWQMTLQLAGGALGLAQCNDLGGAQLLSIDQYQTAGLNGLTAAYYCPVGSDCPYTNVSCFMPGSTNTLTSSCDCQCTALGLGPDCLPTIRPINEDECVRTTTISLTYPTQSLSHHESRSSTVNTPSETASIARSGTMTNSMVYASTTSSFSIMKSTSMSTTTTATMRTSSFPFSKSTPTKTLSITVSRSISSRKKSPSASLIITPSRQLSTSTSASANETRATIVQSATVTASHACRAVTSFNTSVVQSLVVPGASPWQQQQSFEAVAACGSEAGTCGNITPSFGERKASFNEHIEFNLQKSWDIAVVFPVVFVVRLSSPVGRFSTLKQDVGTATSSGLKLTATLSSEDSVTMVLGEDNSFASSVFSTQTLHLTVPVSSIACVGAMGLTDSDISRWTLIISVSLAGQRLVVAQSSLASAGSGASVAAYASLSPSAGAAVARAALLGKLLDCASSDPTRDAGSGVVGSLRFGDAVGQYMRGAIAGNVAVLIGSCAVLVLFGAAVGALSGLKRGVPLSSSCALALDTLHLPGVFAVPLSQLLQPTVSACVSLLIVRGGVSIWDLVMSLLGAVLVLILPVFFAVVLLRNPLCSAVHRRAAFVEAVQQRYFFSKTASNVLLPVWRLTKRLLFVNVRWVPTRADQAKQAKQWKRRYLLLFEDYRVLWYPALDLGTSVGFGIVSGCVGAMGGRIVCIGASIVSLLLYLMLVVAAVFAGVGASRLRNAALVAVNGFGLCASAALIAYTFEPSPTAANVATVCLMLSSVIVTVISIPSFSRVVIRLFWFIKRHLWVTRSASCGDAGECGYEILTVADEVATNKKEEAMMTNTDLSMEEVCTEVPDCDADTQTDDDDDSCDPQTADSSHAAELSESLLPFADMEMDETYLNSELPAAMLMMWQQQEGQHIEEGKGASSWLDDVVAKSTAYELDLLLDRGPVVDMETATACGSDDDDEVVDDSVTAVVVSEEHDDDDEEDHDDGEDVHVVEALSLLELSEDR